MPYSNKGASVFGCLASVALLLSLFFLYAFWIGVFTQS
jgi:hypothetical protein